MKLLLDQNLSRRLVDSLTTAWPDTSHACLHELQTAADRELWTFAKKHGYCLVSKDSDFLHLALLNGAPPKIIIVRTGNASTAVIRHCLLSHQAIIDRFLKDSDESVLVIP